MDIGNPKQYQQFLTELYARAENHPAISCLDSSEEQAKAFLLDATKEMPEFTNKHHLSQILTADSGSLVIAAAAFYLSNCDIEGDTYLQGLLIASDAVTPLAISENTAYYLTSFMGYSDNPQFIPLLYEVLTKSYHFVDLSFVVTALKNLGIEVDDQEIPYRQSIRVTVIKADSNLLIFTDERYTGSSECPNCQFFPCKINDYYSGGIQDCKLWNKTDPTSLVNILDRRDWGNEGHLKSRTVVISKQEENNWKQAQQYMMQKSYLKAIPCLSTLLLSVQTLESNLTASTTPLAWIYLSLCFSSYNESKLAFIAMREANKYKNLIPKNKMGEKKLLESYTFKEEKINEPKNLMQGLNFRKRKQWVKALDCYMNLNICDKRGYGQHWFEMGECHFELREYSLAKLFMTMSIVSTDRNLREKFSNRLKEVDTISENQRLWTKVHSFSLRLKVAVSAKAD
jgi:hypothetical protein